jgi:hypothetical protein
MGQICLAFSEYLNFTGGDQMFNPHKSIKLKILVQY